jgi:hypothetical protein
MPSAAWPPSPAFDGDGERHQQGNQPTVALRIEGYVEFDWRCGASATPARVSGSASGSVNWLINLVDSG